MSEADAIKGLEAPLTVESLAAALRECGLQEGMTVLIHSSLSSLGWVSGGPVAVIEALLNVLGEQGTLVMPTHTGDYSDPAEWENPPVPEAWWQAIRDTMPPFDPAITPSRGMGAIPETFRRWPGVLRSSHPAYSFAAHGPHAQTITGDHQLNYGLGEGSPLARLYELDSWVLLLGVGYDSNTSFHLAEYRVSGATHVTLGAPITLDGERSWVQYKDIDLDVDPFPQIGEAWDATGAVTIGRVGKATVRFFPQPDAVDFAQKWLADGRQ
ncbi:MAG TPA: AAC(3) family N-acetyltransferase [Candidatus Sulfomarinibacteraceae bacterium]|nr:AAC(3) family N-acetyltransferase [Candidatus Sulfomarinibacteraceae bacterium]